MPQVFLKLEPLASSWEDSPSGASECSDPGDLRPFDLAWPEHRVEAFLADHPTEVLKCLGIGSSKVTVWRQLGDIDLVYLPSDTTLAVLVELKKQAGSHAKEAVCQLARNLGRAERVLRRNGHTFVRAVACGQWGRKQLQRARDTMAWEYLEKECANPTFVLYTGAISQSSGARYLVLSEGTPPLRGKGKQLPDDAYQGLSARVEQLSRDLPEGLGMELYRADSVLVLRITADARLRQSYLSSRLGAPRSGVLGAFWRAYDSLHNRGLVTKPYIGQRLELRVQFPRPNDRPSDYTAVRELAEEMALLITSPAIRAEETDTESTVSP